MTMYEITAKGFSGDGSTDDRVFWVLAENEQQVEVAIHNTGARLHGTLDGVGTEGNVDFELPSETDSLKQKLLSFTE